MPKLENQTGTGKVRERLEGHQRKCPPLSSSTRMEARRGSMDLGALEARTQQDKDVGVAVSVWGSNGKAW